MFTTKESLLKYNILMEHCLNGHKLKDYQFPKPKMLIHPCLQDKDIMIIASPRGVGKTWKQLFITRQLVYGVPFCRWESEGIADVVLLDMEMGTAAIEKRWDAITKGLDEPIMNFTIISADVLGMRGMGIPNLTDPEWREAVYHFLRFTLPDGGVFIVDNVSAATPGRIENAKEGWDDINQWLLRLKWELGLTTILCCHLPKKGKSPRGTSGMEDSNDTTITLTNIGNPDHAYFKVEFTKHRLFHGSEHIEPFNLELRPGIDERLEFFTSKPQKQSNRKADVIKLYVDGYTQSDIVSELNIDKGLVSRWIKKTKEDGFLDARGRLTKAGENVFGTEN